MPAIVEFPTVAKKALGEFGDHFKKNEPERKHFGGDELNPMIAAWLPLLIFMPLDVLALEEIKT